MNEYKNFENLLIKNNTTAYQVAKATGVTTATLSQWKKGVYTPKQDKLQKIADFFGVTVDYLLTGSSEEKKYFINNETANIAQKIIDNPALKALFDISVDASTEDIKAVTNMMVTLRNKEKERNKSYIELPVAARTGNNKITKLSKEDYIKIKDILNNLD